MSGAASTKHAGGRPSKFKPEFIEQAAKLIALGAKDADVAAFFGVTEATLNTWKNKHPQFFEALKIAKATADERVERSLFRRAMGYKHKAVKIFMPANATEPVYAPYIEHYPPDTTAMIFWLKNRQPHRWREVSRQEHTGPNGSPLQVTIAPPDADL